MTQREAINNLTTFIGETNNIPLTVFPYARENTGVYIWRPGVKFSPSTPYIVIEADEENIFFKGKDKKIILASLSATADQNVLAACATKIYNELSSY